MRKAAGEPRKAIVYPACLIAIILLTALIRIHLRDIPLERDEGEYAYAGQLILQGIPPYSLACNMKLPGTYAAHALIMAIFGQTIVGIHLGLLVVNAATILLVWLLGKRLFGPAAGVGSAAAYALLSLSPSVIGTASHATHFVALAAAAATVLLARRPEKPFRAGLLYGVAFLMKQHGIFFAAFGALWLLWRRAGLRAFAAYCAGAALPFALACLILWRAGVFASFWFWTFTYASTYAGRVPLSEGIENLTSTLRDIVTANPALWLLALSGLVLAWWKRETRHAAFFTTGFLLFSFLATCPGLYFRGHYFIVLLPAVALLIGAAMDNRRPGISLAVLAAVLAFSVWQERDFLFRMTPIEAARELWGETNPFPEAIPISAWLRDHSGRDARIAVLGSEPEIYLYSRRHSATGYIYMYGLMEPQPYAMQMQNEMIRQIESARPEYIVMVSIQTSWLRRDSSSSRIFDWWSDYQRNYTLTGVADIIDGDHTEYRWNEAARSYHVQSESYVTIYRRNPQKLVGQTPGQTPWSARDPLVALSRQR